MIKTSLSGLDWSLLKVFLAVADGGSYSAAARSLGSSQPTVGRQIDALEEALGLVLFHRHPKGMRVTEAGAGLLGPARAMQAAAGAAALAAAGGDAGLRGTVRITASEFTAHHVLPGIIAEIAEELPEVEIELAASDRTENLLFREADIAVRMVEPRQLDIVARKLGEVPLGLFGARSYLDRAGRPQSLADFADHTFVGYDRDERLIRGFRERGVHVDRHFFRVRCDTQTVYWELVRAGAGLGFTQVSTGAADPLVEQVLVGEDFPKLPVWLAAHEAVYRTPRVRRVWDRLAQGLREVVS